MKTEKYKGIFTLLFTPILICIIICNPTNSASNLPLTSPDDAINMANNIMGITDNNQNARANLIVLKNDNTPFLAGDIIGKDIWRVTYLDIELPGDVTGHFGPKIYTKKVEVYLNPETAELIKIHIPYEGKDTTFLPEPPFDEAQQQMEPTGEVFLDFLNKGDNISLLELLNGKRPVKYQEITAQLLKVIPGLNADTISVWSVTYRGTVPRKLKGRNAEKIPDNMKNYMRYVYDSRSGQLLYRTSIPAPVIKR